MLNERPGLAVARASSRSGESTEATRRRISGSVTRGGNPWAALCHLFLLVDSLIGSLTGGGGHGATS